MEADDNKGQSLYFKNKSCGKLKLGKLNCKGIGAYCVELLYGASKVQVDSWCFCGSKNYGKTCNNSIESEMNQKRKDWWNKRNIPSGAKNAIKKLKNEYLEDWRWNGKKKTKAKDDTDDEISKTVI